MASPVVYFVRRGHLPIYRLLLLATVSLWGCRSQAPGLASSQNQDPQHLRWQLRTRIAGAAIRLDAAGGVPRLYRLPRLTEIQGAIRGRLPALERVVGIDVESEFLYVATVKKELLALDLGSGRVDTVATGIVQAALGPDGTLYAVDAQRRVISLSRRTRFAWPRPLDGLPRDMFGSTDQRLVGIIPQDPPRLLVAAADQPPAVRTIARVLERRGALDAKRRVRRPAPPAGWYLPDVRRRAAELDSFDVIDGLRLKGGTTLDILTGISLHGGLVTVWPTTGVSARLTVGSLDEHWRQVGRPGYAQFDNDPRFIGGTNHPNAIGLVIRFCLAAGVVPVFAPPRETGFQASIEAFNGRWQQKLWARFWDPALPDLQARSADFVAASRQRSAARIEAAPDRAPFPTDQSIDLEAPPSGRLVFIRRTGDDGRASVLSVWYPVDPRWIHRLVRGELDLDARRLRFYALRRREPDDQPLLADLPFEPPARWSR